MCIIIGWARGDDNVIFRSRSGSSSVHYHRPTRFRIHTDTGVTFSPFRLSKGCKEIIMTRTKGTMKTKSWFNITVLAGVGTAALVTGSHRASGASGGGDALPAGEIVQKSREAYAALSSYSDSGTVSSEMDSRKTTLTFNIRLQRPILYRIDWAPEPPPRSAEPAAKWVAQFNKGAVWSDGSGDYLLAAAQGSRQTLPPGRCRI